MGDEYPDQWGEFLSRLRLHFFPALHNPKTSRKLPCPLAEKPRPLVDRAKTLFPESGVQEVHVSPSHLQLFLSLAFLISQNESRLEEADALYREALTLRSDFTNAYLNRGDVLLKMNRSKEAETMYQRAIQHDEENPDLHFNLGIVLMDQGRNSEALEEFNKALDIEPDHERALELSALLMQESSAQTTSI
ncbi:protein O-mannosyl-transferase Tmtc3 [Trichonephila clavipes]|nr:protein O-mannosyl-transferase Tmtc3 [Trichonephila clavipes]